MEVHVIDLADLERDAKIEALAQRISDVGDGVDIDHMLNALAIVTAFGIRAAAAAAKTGCIGWAYRVADQHAEHIKGGIAAHWQEPLTTADPLTSTQPAGNC